MFARVQIYLYYNPKNVSVTSDLFSSLVRFEVFTAVTMKNGVFWDDTPCGSHKNQHFGGMYCLHHQGDMNR
jgi:hypothetical protein